MNNIWRFGLFEIDAQAGELRKEGQRVRLQEQPFQILLCLIRRPGELVTREELQSVWPEDTFVDFDLGLNTAIKKIRVALGDSADNPRFVETLPRKGYRFIAPVQLVTQAEVPAEIPKAPPTPVPPPVRRKPLGLIAAAVLIPIVAAGGWLYSRQKTVSPPVFSSPEPLTAYPGIETQPTFSPDGRVVAFAWNGPEQKNFDIYLKEPGSDAPRQLTTDEGDDFSPAFSPDGKQLAFARRRASASVDERAAIMVMPASGGIEVQVGTALPTPRGVQGSVLTWSPDGRSLVVTSKQEGTLKTGLVAMPVAGGIPRTLVVPEADTNDSCAAFSPDGRTLAFVRSGWGGFSMLYLQDLSSALEPAGPARPARNPGFAFCPVWMPDGKALLAPFGDGHIWKVDIAGSPPRRLDELGGNVTFPAISNSGKLIYSVAGTARTNVTNITRVDLKGTDAPRTALASTRGEVAERYSRDGRRVVFVSERSGSSEVWVANADGSQATRLTSFGGDGMRGWPSWSPDGTKILFDGNAGFEGMARTWHLYVMSAAGGTPVQLTSGNHTNGVAEWSGDGKFIYFYSNRSGSHQIWAMPAAGGPAHQVTKNGGRVPALSPDGRYLYFGRSGQGLWRVPIADGHADGEESLVLRPIEDFQYRPVTDGVYHIGRMGETGDTAIQFFSFATKGDKVIVPLTGQNPGPSLEVSPDGRTLLYSRRKAPESDLMQINLRQP